MEGLGLALCRKLVERQPREVRVVAVCHPLALHACKGRPLGSKGTPPFLTRASVRYSSSTTSASGAFLRTLSMPFWQLDLRV